MLECVASFLYSETHSQRCIGCDRRVSDLLCQACFEGLPQIGRPVCARRGMSTAFETFVCNECKGVDFSFESARGPLRYKGVGKRMVHSLKYRDYTRVVDRLAVPVMLSALNDQSRFVAVVPVPLHRSRLRRREFNKARLLAQGVASKIKAPVSDTIQVARDSGSGGALGRREEDQRFGCVQSQRPRRGRGSVDRRRVHHRRDDELVRRDPLAGWGTRGACSEPLKDMLAISLKQLTISQGRTLKADG